MSESKLKGNGEGLWYGAKGIFADIQEVQRVREGVAVWMNDVWHSAVTDFGCVSSKTLRVKFKFSRFKVCVGVFFIVLFFFSFIFL